MGHANVAKKGNKAWSKTPILELRARHRIQDEGRAIAAGTAE